MFASEQERKVVGMKPAVISKELLEKTPAIASPIEARHMVKLEPDRDCSPPEFTTKESSENACTKGNDCIRINPSNASIKLANTRLWLFIPVRIRIIYKRLRRDDRYK